VTWRQARSILDIDGLMPREKFVLVALALRAGSDGRAWPSVACLVADTGYSERSVHYALRALVDGGHLNVIHRQGTSAVRTLGGANIAGVGVQMLHQPLQKTTKRGANIAPGSVVEELQEVATTGSTAKRPAVAGNGSGPAPGESWGEYRERGGR
jgi:hypothetical protein